MKKYLFLLSFVVGCAHSAQTDVSSVSVPPKVDPAPSTCSPPPAGAYVLKSDRVRGNCKFPKYYDVELNGQQFFEFGDKGCVSEQKVSDNQCVRASVTVCGFTYQDADTPDQVNEGSGVKTGRLLHRGEYTYNTDPKSLAVMNGTQVIMLVSQEQEVICVAEFSVSLIQVGSME